MISNCPTPSHQATELQLPGNRRKIIPIYALTLLTYTVASPDPNPNELSDPKGPLHEPGLDVNPGQLTYRG